MRAGRCGWGPWSLPVILIASLLLGSASGFAQEDDSAPTIEKSLVPIDTLPATFEPWRDQKGFLWQAARSGALGSGEAGYFQGALMLVVRGTAFAPTEGIRWNGDDEASEEERILLKQTADEVEITRDLRFDPVRSGVRVLDQFRNIGDRKTTVRVDLKTSYQNPWQDLHGTEGRILGSRPGAGLGVRDFGVVVKFSSAEGRHDTLFVTSSEKGAVRPLISYSSNLRELTFSYDLEIGPGDSAGLLHWVAQRNLQRSIDAEAELKPFYQRRQLVAPVVASEEVATIRNFELQAFPKPGAQPFDLDALVSLNRVLEPVGVVRRNEDVLWISGENQLSGTVNPEASLRIATAWGERTASMSEVAAIEGGGGLGRTPRVFLRDGRVWSGAIEASNLTIKVAEGWEVEALRPEELRLLLMRVNENDGRPPEGASLFVALRSGDVVAAAADGEQGDPLTVLTPWGESAIPLEEIRELHYATGESMAPRFRLLRRDGAVWTVFLGQTELTLSLKDKAVEEWNSLVVKPVDIAGAWSVGHEMGRAAMDPADEWFDLEDAAAGSGTLLPDSAILLSGNNLFHGEFAQEKLNVVANGLVTPIGVADIVSLRRSLDSDSETSPIFEIETSGEEILTGRLRERILLISSAGREWQVPSKHLIAFSRSAESRDD